MSWLGLAGSAIGGLLGLKGQSDAYAQQEALMQKQIDWQKEVLQNKAQWAVKDLRAAGLNPLLAVSQGGFSASSSAPSVSAPTVQNGGQAAAQSAAAIAGILNNMRQTSIADKEVQSKVDVNSAQKGLIETQKNYRQAELYYGLPFAQTAKEFASAKESTVRATMMFDQMDAIRAGIEKTNAEIENLEAARDQIKANIVYLESLTGQARSQTALNYAHSTLAGIEGKLKKAYTENEMLRGEGLELENTFKRLDLPYQSARSHAWNIFNRAGGQYTSDQGPQGYFWLERKYGKGSGVHFGPIGGFWP